MATSFSGSTDQRGIGGDMPFHRHPPSNLYSDSSTGGLIPLPATVMPQSHVALGDGRHESAFLNAMEGPTNSVAIGLQRQLLMLNGQANAPAMQHQGLSLSLGTEVPVSLYQSASLLSVHQTNSSIQNSKYLKATRELLDEAVNVRDAVKRKAEKKQGHTSSECKDADRSEEKDSSSAELSPSERQDLQNKVTALLAMLDQVDGRYRHYHHQMQLVVSSFDAVAGPGAARPYTALALQTISHHFRSLRDAVSAQVQSARRSLCEPDASAAASGITRLRYLDQQIRQQRAMQQFGMAQQQQQQQAWRPQRGLPESAVSVLRAWLFEHFLHPYPKDSEKLMLARQAGLTRGQVSNWFINARVRLWKPMIEEMYKEEFGAETDSNSSSENAGNGKDEGRCSEDRGDMQSTSSGMRHGVSQLNPFKSEVMAGTDTAAAGLSNLGGDMNAYGTDLSLERRGPNVSNGSLLQDALARHHDGSGRFMAYDGMAELGGYDNGGVSLTLGLQHSNGTGTVPAGQQGLLTVQGDGIYGNAGGFEYMAGSEDQQRFDSSQLLHDFVA